MLASGRHDKRLLETTNANDKIVAEAMSNIDAEYEALCAEYATVAA